MNDRVPQPVRVLYTADTTQSTRALEWLLAPLCPVTPEWLLAPRDLTMRTARVSANVAHVAIGRARAHLAAIRGEEARGGREEAADERAVLLQLRRASHACVRARLCASVDDTREVPYDDVKPVGRPPRRGERRGDVGSVHADWRGVEEKVEEGSDESG